jgi:hypothetical protein
MATDERFDESISKWLEETAPARLPERVLSATFERTRRSRQQVGWRALLGRIRITRSVLALAGATVVVMAAALTLNFNANLPGLGGPVPAADPRSSFLGTWFSADADRSTQTMTARASGDGAVDIVVHDDYASVCSGVPSTMAGTGQLEGSTELLIPSPVYTCDDGSQPEALSGPPLEEQLQNLTFTHDPGTDTLTDNFGSVWTREGADPSPEPTTSLSEAEVTELLNGFLEARVAGEAAQQYLNVPEEDIPLLYATTSGAPYERAEFERVRGTEWPYGWMAFKVRLFAGDTVVEQLFFTGSDLGLEYQPDGFGTDIAPTTENGQPVALPYNYFDGEVTLHAAHPWVFYDYSIHGGSIFGRLIPEGPGVRPTTDGGERNDWDRLVLIADPVGTDCQTGPGTADAEALAESIRSDPNLEATAPVAVSAGGAEALMMDVVIAAGTSICDRVDHLGNPLRLGVLSPVFGDWAEMDVDNGLATGLATGDLMRLYLFDVPEGSSMRILAIAIIAPESRFERAVEAAAPVVDSVEFHTR